MIVPSIRRLVAALLSILPLSATIAEESAETSVRRLVSLVEYIGGDYTEAVQAGKVVNADEYKEMQDFASASAGEFGKLSAKLPADVRGEVQGNLAALKTLIEQKADVAAIRGLTGAIKNRVIDALGFDTTPTVRPEKGLAVAKYAELCASCHGTKGEGDGPASKGMEPPPRNFHETGVLDVSSPFKFFNTLVLGVEGTSMVSYAKSLGEKERWSLAFQAMGMSRDAGGKTPEQIWQALPAATRDALAKGGLSLALLARKSDLELREWLRGLKTIPANELEASLSALRTAAPYLDTTPRTAQVEPLPGPEAPRGGAEPSQYAALLDKTRAHIAEAQAAFAEGDRGTAEAKLLDAYLNGFEGLEAPLGVHDKALVTKVEQDFIAARKAAREGDAAALDARVAAIGESLDRVATLLAAPKAEGSGTADFAASLVIILREGFEAFLIVGAMLALLRKSGAGRSVVRIVHLGWLSAIVAGFASYYLFISVFELSGAARETVEAVCTGAAAMVLFYVSFWLLNQAERGKWDGLVRNFTNAAGSSSRLGLLFFVSFIAVYREAAETVLFYAALAASATSKSAVAGGFVAGTALLGAIVWGIVYWGVRIPMKRFFVVTSAAMITLSVVLAGKAMNELVEAGFIQPTTISPFPTIDLLGIYPQWESIAVQIAAAVAAAFLAYRQVALGKQQRQSA
jgi:high-affinity iron transporter